MNSTAYYPYTPDVPFAIIGVGVYTVLAGIHAFQVVSKEAWDGSFMVLGCLAQAMGCGARLISSWDIHDKLSWAAQKLLLLWGPALIMFTICLSSTEFTKTYKPKRFVPPWIARPLYFALNSVLFLLMSLAAFMEVATAEHEVHAGHKLLRAVFIIRLLFWTFILLGNTASHNDHQCQPGNNVHMKPRFEQYYLVLQDFFIVAFIHNIIQLVRLYSGPDGFMNATEWPLYALDILLGTRPLLEWKIWYWSGGCMKSVGS
ncbi:RTA-like protein [Aspergillus oryzae]|uniref:RTA-like protein n=3 Tax=Aspergillus subgen. Circumdati TaxID=2720871 RepID=A0A1S9DF24_ASPOZ|nr:RTA-like protein [Aspergillus oryzae]